MRREKEQEYHKQFVEPFDEGLRIIEEKKKLAEENPEVALKDPFFLAVAGFGKKFEKLKLRLEQSVRSLLFAHAGGAVLTINMLPSIIDNKILLKIAADSLENFTLGLLSLLISYILITFTSWANLVQDLLKAMNKEISLFEKLTNFDLDGPALFFAGIFGLISFLLFVATIYAAGNAIGNLI